MDYVGCHLLRLFTSNDMITFNNYQKHKIGDWEFVKQCGEQLEQLTKVREYVISLLDTLFT